MSLRARSFASALAAVAVAASGCESPGPAAAAPSPGCAVWQGLTEKVLGTTVNELGGPYPSQGNSSAYVAELYGADGAKVGSIAGRTDISRRLLDGRLQEHAVETIELPGGVITAQGVYDAAAKLAGDRVRTGLVGTAGGYLGHLGDRYARATAGGESRVDLELCPPGMLRAGR
jgi:hypothetical protein